MKAAILASGYIGYPNEDLIVKPIVINDWVKYVLIKDYLRAHSKYFYSSEAHSLYTTMLENNVEINKIDIRIRVIREAKKLFDGKNILEWVKLQKHNPLKTKSHIEFIKNVLSFIQGKSTDRLDTMTWSRLIMPDAINKDDIVAIDNYLDEVLIQFKDMEHMSLNNILHQWLQQPNGYINLINTLYIFYGPRNEIFALN